jgi:hypothetical protein
LVDGVDYDLILMIATSFIFDLLTHPLTRFIITADISNQAKILVLNPSSRGKGM